jgi:multiple sugar transport system substrate-binding protein
LKEAIMERLSRRRFLGSAVGVAALTARGAPVTRAWAQPGKPYAGTRIKMAQVAHAYGDGLVVRLPAFEQQSGIKVEIDQMSFPVLNQREDLELASGSGAYDVMQMIFIRSGRWIGAGWAEPLNPFIENAQLTDKTALDVNDFVPGAMAPFKRGETIYALPWLSDSTVVGYRADILDKAGYAKFPETFEALEEAAKKIHTRQTAAFVTEDNLHWIFPNWLLSYGGNFFANPPSDLTPTFDTPEAIKAAELFTTMLAKYSPPGGIKLDPSVAQAIMQQGKAACYLDGMGNTQHIIDAKKTALADRMAFTHTPRGPKGHFPQLAVHGYFINKASKNKNAAWEVIKWAVSKDTMLWNALNRGHLACTRTSVLGYPEVRQKFTWHGADLAALHLGVMKRAGEGYMVYRTVPQFPPIGDRVIIAMTAIASGQVSVVDGMKALQKDAEGILEKAGVKINRKA